MSAPGGKPPSLFLIGWLLILSGAGVAFYFLAVFDTSVLTSSGDRVNNVGLLSDRQNGVVISTAAAVVGVLLAIFFRPKPETPPSLSTPDMAALADRQWREKTQPGRDPEQDRMRERLKAQLQRKAPKPNDPAEN